MVSKDLSPNQHQKVTDCYWSTGTHSAPKSNITKSNARSATKKLQRLRSATIFTELSSQHAIDGSMSPIRRDWTRPPVLRDGHLKAVHFSSNSAMIGMLKAHGRLEGVSREHRLVYSDPEAAKKRLCLKRPAAWMDIFLYKQVFVSTCANLLGSVTIRAVQQIG